MENLSDHVPGDANPPVTALAKKLISGSDGSIARHGSHL
jgi:hypothetical protein